jgi:hypothetical protein
MYPMGAGEPRRGMICRTTGVVAATDAVVTLGGSMAASGGRRVDETEIPQNENLEVEVSEGHDNGDRRMNRGGVSDPKVDRTQQSTAGRRGIVREDNKGLHCAAKAEGGIGGREEDVDRGENPSDNAGA